MLGLDLVILSLAWALEEAQRKDSVLTSLTGKGKGSDVVATQTLDDQSRCEMGIGSALATASARKKGAADVAAPDAVVDYETSAMM